MNFGEKIRFIRRVKGMTQSDLAIKSDISIPYMNQIEKGKSVESIGDNIIKRIADALETSPEELKSSGKPDISGYTSNQPATAFTNVSDVSTTNLESAFEAERRGWQSLEASLRDTIARQEETISFLKELIRTLRSYDADKMDSNITESR